MISIFSDIYANMSNHLELPFGLKVLPDRTGLISSSFVLFVWLYGHIAVFIPILLPHHKDGNVPSLVFYGKIYDCIYVLYRRLETNSHWQCFAGYILLSLCTITCFFQAMFSSPGVVPRVATDKVTLDVLQF